MPNALAGAMTTKLAGIPAWGWAGIVGAGGAAALVVIRRNRKSGASSTPMLNAYGPASRPADELGAGEYGSDPGWDPTQPDPIQRIIEAIRELRPPANDPGDDALDTITSGGGGSRTPTNPTQTQPASSGRSAADIDGRAWDLNAGERVGSSSPVASVFGIGFQNSYEGDPTAPSAAAVNAVGWVPRTNPSTSIQAPPGGILSHGTWTGTGADRRLVTGTYKLPDGSYATVRQNGPSAALLAQQARGAAQREANKRARANA